MELACLLCMGLEEIGVVDQGSYAGMFDRLFSTTTPRASLSHFDAFTDKRRLPTMEEAKRFHGVVITGSPQSVLHTHKPWIRELSEFIRTCYEQRVPLVGVCFGHQIIATALGGVVEHRGFNMGVDEYALVHAPHTFPFIQAKRSGDRPPTTFRSCASHEDQVTTLPKNAVTLARSSRCPHAAYVEQHRILGLQFHPEFSPQFQKIVVHALRDQLGERFHESLGRLEADVDNELVAQWVVNWLRQRSAGL